MASSGIRCAAIIASAEEVKYVFPSGDVSNDKIGWVCGLLMYTSSAVIMLESWVCGSRCTAVMPPS